MGHPAFRSYVTGKEGDASRELMQWIQDMRDHPLGQMIVTDTGVSPAIKKHGAVLWKDTNINKQYIIYYDGTNKYFWECSGIDLY